MNERTLLPPDLAALSTCATELAQAFVTLSSDIALVMDEQGVIQSVAQSTAAPISQHANSWVGRPWIETVSGETRRKVESMLSDLKVSGVARRREINVVGSGSDAVPVAFSALRLGATGPLLVVGKDLRAVSAIQQRFLDTQQELERGYWRARQSESRYRQLFQVATDGVLTVDAHTLRVIEANHAAGEWLGSGLPLAGRPARELMGSAYQGALHELLLNARSTGKPSEVHVRVPRSQELAAVSATPFRVGDDLRLLLRVRLAAAMEVAAGTDSRVSLAQLVDSFAEGVVVTDSTGRIVMANPAFLSMLNGMTEEQVCGRGVGEWLGRTEGDVAVVLAGAHEQGIAHLVRSCLRQPHGQVLDVDVTAALLADGDQECFGFTVRRSDPATDPLAAWVRAITDLDEQVGQTSLSQLMAESTRLIERRFLTAALLRTGGDEIAAAALLGLEPEALKKLLAQVEQAGASPATFRS